MRGLGTGDSRSFIRDSRVPLLLTLRPVRERALEGSGRLNYHLHSSTPAALPTFSPLHVRLMGSSCLERGWSGWPRAAALLGTASVQTLTDGVKANGGGFLCITLKRSILRKHSWAFPPASVPGLPPLGIAKNVPMQRSNGDSSFSAELGGPLHGGINDLPCRMPLHWAGWLLRESPNWGAKETCSKQKEKASRKGEKADFQLSWVGAPKWNKDNFLNWKIRKFTFFD